MFFECVVATKLWDMISQAAGVVVGGSFENFDARWLCNKRFLVINMISSATLWALWKKRNNVCFQNVQWRNMKEIVGKMVGLLQNLIVFALWTRETV
jgi:hypothetical protein